MAHDDDQPSPNVKPEALGYAEVQALLNAYGGNHPFWDSPYGQRVLARMQCLEEQGMEFSI